MKRTIVYITLLLLLVGLKSFSSQPDNNSLHALVGYNISDHPDLRVSPTQSTHKVDYTLAENREDDEDNEDNSSSEFESSTFYHFHKAHNVAISSNTTGHLSTAKAFSSNTIYLLYGALRL